MFTFNFTQSLIHNQTQVSPQVKINTDAEGWGLLERQIWKSGGGLLSAAMNHHQLAKTRPSLRVSGTGSRTILWILKGSCPQFKMSKNLDKTKGEGGGGGGRWVHLGWGEGMGRKGIQL